MQQLLSDKKYKSNYEEIKDKYHLDIATPTFITAKRAAKLLSDVSFITMTQTLQMMDK